MKCRRGTKALSAKGHQLFLQLLLGSRILSGQFEIIIVLVCHQRLFPGAYPQFLIPLQNPKYHFQSLYHLSFQLNNFKIQFSRENWRREKKAQLKTSFCCVCIQITSGQTAEISPGKTYFWKKRKVIQITITSPASLIAINLKWGWWWWLLFFHQSNHSVALDYSVHTKNGLTFYRKTSLLSFV